MKAVKSIFLIFVALLSLFVSVTGLGAKIDLTSRVLQILFLPVTGYLLYVLVDHIFRKTPVFNQKTGFGRIIIYYCFIITTAVVSVGFLSSIDFPQFLSALIFSPMAIYFLLLVWPKRKQALPLRKSELALLVAPTPKLDVSRRDFLKLIGSAGILAVIMGLFSRRSGISSFLGGGTGQESVTLKDTSGNVINPAENSPTDGYSITQIDDSIPSYFGFVDKNGNWFIMREGEDSAYRYAKGGGNFASNWSNRTILDYNYFDKVF
jgi:hypothetical protein